MSNVTNVMVSVGILEGDAVGRLVTPWAYSPDGQALDDISAAGSHHWGGHKMPTCSVYAAAFNYLQWPEFSAHVESCGWEDPDVVQVFVMGDDDDAWSVWHLDAGRLVCGWKPA